MTLYRFYINDTGNVVFPFAKFEPLEFFEVADFYEQKGTFSRVDYSEGRLYKELDFSELKKWFRKSNYRSIIRIIFTKVDKRNKI